MLRSPCCQTSPTDRCPPLSKPSCQRKRRLAGLGLKWGQLGAGQSPVSFRCDKVTGQGIGPVDMRREDMGSLWPRSHGLPSTRQLERETVLLNHALTRVKPPRFMRVSPARVPSKVYLVLQSTQRNPCVPLFQATQSKPTLHGWARLCEQPTRSVLEAPHCSHPELLG